MEPPGDVQPTQAARPLPPRFRVPPPALQALALLALVLVAYWPVLHGEFVWDDLLLVDQNPVVKGEFTPGSIWFQTDFPLSVLAFWGQWLLWGRNAAGYHIVNVALHAFNVLLVWLVLRRLVVSVSPKPTSSSSSFSSSPSVSRSNVPTFQPSNASRSSPSRFTLPSWPWLAAALFAVHPVCVASAGWISELKNTLSLFFYLLGFWAYLESEALPAERLSVPGTDAPRRAGLAASSLYCLAIFAFVLALLSKTAAVVLPFVLLAWTWWSRGRLSRRDFLRLSPFAVLALGFGLLTIWFQTHQVITGLTVQTENFWGRLGGAGIAVWFYLGKALLPVHLNLVYPRWEIHPGSPLVWLPLLGLVALFVVCWRFRHGWGRQVLFALVCFVASLLPALGLIDMYFLLISRVSDHFQYFALVPLLALVAATLARWLPARIYQVTAVLLLAGFCLAANRRAAIFSTEAGLWQDVLAKNAAAWPAHNNLGCILAERQDIDGAMRHFETALKYNPLNAGAHANLGRALALRGKTAEAEAHLRSAIQIKPRDPGARQQLAELLAGQGKVGEAVQQLREVVRIQPASPVRAQLAALLAGSGQPQEAVAEFRRALQQTPRSVEVLNNLAWLLATCADDSVRNGKEAVALAQQACELTHNLEEIPQGTLAAAYAEAGRFEDAAAAAQKAIALANSTGNTRFAALNQRLLQLYRAGKAYREGTTSRRSP